MQRTFLKFEPRSPTYGPNESSRSRKSAKKKESKGRGRKERGGRHGGKGEVDEGPKHPLWTSSFVAKMKFRNHLPAVPVDSVFLAYPFPDDRFTAYKPTTLERDNKDLVLLKEAGVETRASLIDPREGAWPEDLAAAASTDPVQTDVLVQKAAEASAARASRLELADEDTRLIELGARSLQENATELAHVTFLRKGQYLGNEFVGVHAGVAANPERLHGRSALNTLGEDRVLTLEEQRDVVDATFVDAGKAPVHPRVPGMKAKRVLEIVPSSELDSERLNIVTFQGKPAAEPAGAVIKGGEHDGDTFVMYLLPKSNKRQRRLDDDDVSAGAAAGSDPSELEWIREFNYETRAPPELFMLTVDGDAASYAPINTVLSLHKRKPVGSFQAQHVRPASITSTRVSAEELAARESALGSYDDGELDDELGGDGMDDMDRSASPTGLLAPMTTA
ncbi:uncharacterized protein AMSG_04775 [Thecamonas trahens ATCC 50062]|uniref:Uncharacterized protein n=1 Tax=Thecamonas trahens ATCC 50062 TaxID=461836 RepID=A0A0L0DAB9_THETB|nr:hypothetical protein AMSG_04775 [Thecamonas trahens ATCC 50062]KNC49031.1 hypothetical protein AMSG_04775 [Thecamonas trahens ATCC 50062]|eukprot:XP_013758441.1 hypothetical protein AMSG_04775 [Thecamonas trahens ATCC 50062]